MNLRSNRNPNFLNILELIQKGISKNERQQTLEFTRKNLNRHLLSSQEEY